MCCINISNCVFVTPVMNMYPSETLNDEQLGLAYLLHYVQCAMISVTTEFLVKLLHPSGLFNVLGINGILTFVFLYIFQLETKGLTDKEKKELYIPKKYLKEVQEIEMK